MRGRLGSELRMLIQPENWLFPQPQTGVFKAVLVNLDDSLEENEDIRETYKTCGQPTQTKYIDRNRTSFLTEMLSSSQENLFLRPATVGSTSPAYCNTRNQTPEQLLFAQLSKEQEEAEQIVLKKKEEEDRKRREAEEIRRTEESEALKKAAELKRKRDKEDLRIQKEMQLKRLRQEEARQKVLEEKKLEEAREKQKQEEEQKRKQKFERIWETVLEKDQINEAIKNKQLEEFNKTKSDHLVRLGSKSPSGALLRETSYTRSPSLPHMIENHKNFSQLSNSSYTLHTTDTKSTKQDLQPSLEPTPTLIDITNREISLGCKADRADHENTSSMNNVIEPAPKLAKPGTPEPSDRSTQLFIKAELEVISPSSRTDTQLQHTSKENIKSHSLPDSLKGNFSPTGFLDQKAEVPRVDAPTEVPRVDAPKVPRVDAPKGSNNKVLSSNVKFSSTEISAKAKLENLHTQKSKLWDLNANLVCGTSSQASPAGQASFSTRWRDVHTGLVRDRASTYLTQDKPQEMSHQNSPRLQKKLPITNIKLSTGTRESQREECPGVRARNYIEGPVPWRKRELQTGDVSPSVKLGTISVNTRWPGETRNTEPGLGQGLNQSSPLPEYGWRTQGPGDSYANVGDSFANIGDSYAAVTDSYVAVGAAEAVAHLDQTMTELQAQASALSTGEKYVPAESQVAKDSAPVAAAEHQVARVSAPVTAAEPVRQLRSFSLDRSGGRLDTWRKGDVGEDTQTKPQQSLQAIKDLIAGRGPGSLASLAGEGEQDRTLRRFARMRTRRFSAEEEEEQEEDSLGEEEDFSIGIDVPLALDFNSGNVTPTPTTGELEELSSIEEPTVLEQLIVESKVESAPSSARKVETTTLAPSAARTTPLKSLLKKPSLDEYTDDSDSDSEDDGKISPKKVHFSEIDQIKLMSQESLASMVASESNEVPPVRLCTTLITFTPLPSVPRLISRGQEIEGTRNFTK